MKTEKYHIYLSTRERNEIVMYSSARRKNRHKKDRKIFIGTKEITVYI